jgi:hypothetical protein
MSEQVVILIVVAVNAWLLLMAHKAWRLGQENYSRLPDRIPVHFGLTGKVDRYARKSRLSVFWAPAASVITQVFMTGVFWTIYKAEGPDAAVILLLGEALTFSVCWIMVRVQSLIINTALGVSAGAWSYMGAPLALMLVLTVLFTAWPFYMLSQPAQFQSAVICETVDSNLKPIGSGQDFSEEAKSITILTSWKNLNGDVRLEYRWYGPGGELVHRGEFKKKYKQMKFNRSMWYRLDLPYFRQQGMAVAGDWSVEVYEGGRKITREPFRVTPAQ